MEEVSSDGTDRIIGNRVDLTSCDDISRVVAAKAVLTSCGNVRELLVWKSADLTSCEIGTLYCLAITRVSKTSCTVGETKYLSEDEFLSMAQKLSGLSAPAPKSKPRRSGREAPRVNW